MKRITLVRHGKSSWEHRGLSDAERPLLPKGIRRTRLVAQRLMQLSLTPDIIVTSHAVRALDTAAIVASIMGIPEKDILINKQLYLCAPDDIWDVISALPDEKEHVMLFGHNPGFTDFANSSRITTIDWLPTSGVASAAFTCQLWHQCPGAFPENPLLILPKNLT